MSRSSAESPWRRLAYARTSWPSPHRVGYDYIHSAVDDHSRLAYSEICSDERGPTAAAFWTRAMAFFAAHGIVVQRVLTDDA